MAEHRIIHQPMLPRYVGQPTCTCGWKGSPTDDMTAADAEADAHVATALLEWETGPFPGAPKAKLTDDAWRILNSLREDKPTKLAQNKGVMAVSLSRRGLAAKDGRAGWRRTRRGTLWIIHQRSTQKGT